MKPEDKHYVIMIECSLDEWDIIKYWANGDMKERAQDILKIIRSK